MAATAQLRLCHLSLAAHIQQHRQPLSNRFLCNDGNLHNLNLRLSIDNNHKNVSVGRLSSSASVGGGGGGGLGGSGGYGGGGHNRDDPSDGGSGWVSKLGILGMFVRGWQSRVAADPQFPFKVLMEELVGVTACVVGDMASRPNFGLNELDFVFSTLVVGSILNFTLMYLLAPTAAVSSAASSALPSHMFEPGPFSLLGRCGTLVYKGAVFAAVGFAAGLVGTAVSNGLIAVRKRMDPAFETPNKPPPTLLNATTWALHMGISSNLRYQTLNGLEFVLDKCMPSPVFKTSVVALRCANNVLGGMSFVILARLTGSQTATPKTALEEEEEKLIDATQQPTTTTTTTTTNS